MKDTEKKSIDLVLKNDILNCSWDELDKKVSEMESDELFDRLLSWIGIVGYSRDIKVLIEYCYGISLKDNRKEGLR